MRSDRSDGRRSGQEARQAHKTTNDHRQGSTAEIHWPSSRVIRSRERYGIENYFPQSSIEVVVGQSLGRYFPIPHHLSVVEYLRDDRGQSPWERVKRYLAWRYGLRFKFAGQKLYNKNLNQKVSELLVLDKDLSGTDLGDIIHRIADRAKALAKDS